MSVTAEARASNRTKTRLRVVAAVTDEELVRDAREAAVAATSAEADASGHRWRMADDYAQLRERGWTQRRIGQACGVSQQLVSFYLTCAKVYYPGSSRPPFQQAYREAQRATDTVYQRALGGFRKRTGKVALDDVRECMRTLSGVYALPEMLAAVVELLVAEAEVEADGDTLDEALRNIVVELRDLQPASRTGSC